MSQYDKDELKAVELKIETLRARQLVLKKKARRERLSTDEEVELEDVRDTLIDLKAKEKYWQELIKIQTKDDAEPESKSFREADENWTASVTGINTSYRAWTTYLLDVSIKPSDLFRSRFEQSVSIFHMINEAGRRIVLNDFLLDILARPEFKNALKVFPEMRMEVTQLVGNKRRKIVGDTDYTIGFGKGLDIFSKIIPKELHLIAIEAKVAWDLSDFWQCVAETATLFKSRKDAGKQKCAVWGVLSNAEDWQFIYIDEDGLLWRSDKISISLHEYNEEKVLKVYQFLYFVVKSCFEASTPNPTPATSSADLN
jgi:uncharacterized protein YbaR (Trm112 family)